MRARALWWLPGLLLFAAVMHPMQHAFAGVRFQEPFDTVCYDQAPPGWFETTTAEATWTGFPPRVECRMLNRATGETAYWDSGNAAVAPFVAMVLALVAAASVAAAVATSTVVHRLRRPLTDQRPPRGALTATSARRSGRRRARRARRRPPPPA